MISLTEFSLRRGKQLLLEDVNLTIHRGYKLGLTGGNGSGKSSLFALIRGELTADKGELQIPARLSIAHVAQETPALDVPAVEYVLQGDTELIDLEQRLADAEAKHDADHLGPLHERLAAIDGYAARSRAARLMHGLGFSPTEYERAVKTFSGGWRMRLNLAQALMCRSDLLLLDEPTNHLDLDAVIWLEDWLKRYDGTLLLISHDRDFLDSVCGHIAHIEQHNMRLYTGNYSDFEIQRAAQLANQQAAHEKQQREIDHMQDFVRRFKAKASKAKQAQSRVKALERMQKIAPAHVDSPFRFRFFPPERIPDTLIRLEHASVGYDETIILSDLDARLAPGERIGLLGHNGAGKSTFIRLLAGELQSRGGHGERAKDLNIGYFAQHQLEQLDAQASALLHMQRLDKKAREQELLSWLGGFGFCGERVHDPVAPFSGGEKARLVLAMLVYQRPNLLLLDEPTNHLDLEMRLALTTALQGYEGCMVLVSHDRHLLRSVTDSLWLVADGGLTVWDGDVEDYARLQRKTGTAKEDAAEPQARAASPVVDARQRRQKNAEQRKRLQPLRNREQRLDKTLSRLMEKQKQLQEALARPEMYEEANKAELLDLLHEQARLQNEIEQVESEWMEVSEELESAQE